MVVAFSANLRFGHGLLARARAQGETPRFLESFATAKSSLGQRLCDIASVSQTCARPPSGYRYSTLNTLASKLSSKGSK